MVGTDGGLEGQRDECVDCCASPRCPLADDYRIFCGDLANDVNDEILARAFRQYPSFLKAKIVRDKHSQKSRGYGFVSFKDPHDFMNALKEMNGECM